MNNQFYHMITLLEENVEGRSKQNIGYNRQGWGSATQIVQYLIQNL